MKTKVKQIKNGRFGGQWEVVAHDTPQTAIGAEHEICRRVVGIVATERLANIIATDIAANGLEPKESTSRVAGGTLLVRYCPGCGRVGPVGNNHRNCCPDGSSAVEVPRAVAEQARRGLKADVQDHHE